MSKLIDFFVFRHGETDWNLQKRFQGHTDIPLNSNGREQAEKLKFIVSQLGVEHVLSSDLSRAKETARIAFQDHNLVIEESTDLREALLGDVEGLYRTEVIERYGDGWWQRW